MLPSAVIRSLALLWVVMLLPPVEGTGSAQVRPAALSGEVIDSTGAAVAAASIVVRRESVGVEQRVASTNQGAFQLGGLQPGTYEIRVESPGFASGIQRVTVEPGEERRVRFTLQVGGLSEAVTVLAHELAGGRERLRRLPGSVDVLDRETLAASRIFTTSEALRKIPGVHVRDEEGFGLRPNIGIRGINPTRSNQVLLLEDGIPLAYAPYGDNASYYHPPIDRFERIEVMKGGAQIAYGPQTVAGAINYITPLPPTQSAGAATLTAGNRDFVNGHLNYGTTVGRTGFMVDAMRKQGDGAREHIHSQLHDLNAKVVHEATARQTWTFRANYYGEDSNVTYSGLRQDEFLASPRGNPFSNDAFYTDRFGTSATHAYSPSGNVALATNFYYSRFSRHWWRQSSNSGQRPNDASDPACGGMANLHTTCGNEGRLRQYSAWGVEPRMRMHHGLFGISGEADFGVRVHLERQDRRQENGDTPTARSGRLVEDNLRENQAYSAFLLNRFLAGGFTVTPGVRVEHVRFQRTNRLANEGLGVEGTTSLTHLVPGVGVSYSAHERLTLFAGVHRGFAPPRTEDMITNTGGVVELDPELSWSYELGARTAVRPGVRVDATLFRMDYENQVIPASLAGGLGATLTNGGATFHQGVEIGSRLDSAAITGSMHNVFARVAYTWLPVARFEGTRFSNVPGFGTVPVTGNRLPYAPGHLGTFGVGYAHPSGFDVSLEAVRTGEQFGDDLNTVAPSPDGQRGLLPGHTVWNAAVNYRLGRSTLFASVKNLRDELFIVDRSRGILPGSPRLVHAGVQVRF